VLYLDFFHFFSFNLFVVRSLTIRPSDLPSC
jgi:hypothetical protein